MIFHGRHPSELWAPRLWRGFIFEINLGKRFLKLSYNIISRWKFIITIINYCLAAYCLPMLLDILFENWLWLRLQRFSPRTSKSFCTSCAYCKVWVCFCSDAVCFNDSASLRRGSLLRRKHWHTKFLLFAFALCAPLTGNFCICRNSKYCYFEAQAEKAYPNLCRQIIIYNISNRLFKIFYSWKNAVGLV